MPVVCTCHGAVIYTVPHSSNNILMTYFVLIVVCGGGGAGGSGMYGDPSGATLIR